MSRSATPFQMLLMAVAGLASFYVALQWSRSLSSPPEPVVEAVSVERDDRRDSDRKPAAQEPVPQRDHSLAPPDRTGSIPDADGDAFAIKSWLPPPPPVKVVAPPPPPKPPVPVAPPLPFTFVGLMEQGAARPQAFLAKGETLLIIGAGDVIDNNTYRVDTVNAHQIVMTFLPLNTPQTLPISGGTR